MIVFNKLKNLNKVWRFNEGAFSPFMFGLLMGIGVMSMSAAYIAKQRLVKMQLEQQEKQISEAEKIKRALETSILTETRESYGESTDLDKALKFVTGTTGRTRSGDKFAIKSFTTEETLGRQGQRLIITSSDDRDVRDDLDKVTDKDATLSDELAQESVVFDEEKLRREQIQKSYNSMDALAGHLYTYYAMNLKFPTENDFIHIENLTKLKDVWGETFDYVKTDDNNATLTFSTPWGYERKIELSLD